MNKYDRLESIGEQHLIDLMKVLNPRQGLSNQLLFNENDSLSVVGEIILFHLDDGIYTLSVIIFQDNTFKLLYYEPIYEDNGIYLFSFNNVPFEISEEWHFQLSTQKRMPFTHEFHVKLNEFVFELLKLMGDLNDSK